MTTYPLTPRQKQILDFIASMIQKRGYPPSLREIAEHFDIAGVRAVEKHVQALERKGYLRKGAGARALELVGHAQGRSLPILGKVAAGQPILAEEHLLGNLMIDPSIAPSQDAYLLKIKGQSMKEIGIMEGDLVVVKPQPDAESGEIVVAMVEGEATVKRLIKKKQEYVLMPENADFKPIVIKENDGAFQILGKVVSVIRLNV
jgi:repressor LexA